MSDLVKVNSEEFGIEESRAKELTSGLIPHLQERKLLIQEFESIKDLELTEENTKIFRVLRLKFRDNRTKGINQWHKTAKEIPLRISQLIDAIKRNEISTNELYEKKLEDGEKHFERLEKERLDKIQSQRVNELSKYVDDAEERDLSSMDDDVWNAYLETKKKAYHEKIEAEKKAEAERLAKIEAEKKEQERIRKENAKLKKEAEEREKREKEEEQKRLEAENKRKAKEEAERKKREEKEKKERAEYEAKLKSEKEAREKVEREEKIKREKLEAELKAKKEAEEKRIREEEERLQAKLSQGDEDNFKDLVNDITELKTKYTFKSKKYQKKHNDVKSLIDKILNHIK